MTTVPFVHLGGAKLDGTVLDNLKAAGAAQSFISDTLNAALKAKFANAETRIYLKVVVSMEASP